MPRQARSFSHGRDSEIMSMALERRAEKWKPVFGMNA
jgi:hypothetical protein